MANPLRIQNTSPVSLKTMSDADMDWLVGQILSTFAGSNTGVGTLSINPSPNTGLTFIGSIYDYSVAFDPLPSFAGSYAGSNFSPSYQTFFSGFGGSFFTNSETFAPQFGTDPLRSYAPTAGFTAETYVQAYRGNNTNYAGTAYGVFAAGYIIDPSNATTPTAAPTYYTEVEYEFFQDLQSADETSLIRPVEWVTSQGIKIQVDDSLNDSIMEACLSNLVSGGVGMYALSVSAPATPGTWSARDTITDTKTGETDIVYTLWRKTVESAAELSDDTEYRPLRSRTIGNQFSLIEFSDSDIETLVSRFRNRIVATGIGTYAVQENAPGGGGTWTSSGDTIQDQVSPTYVGTFSTTYATSYEATFRLEYAGYAHQYISPLSYTSPNYTSFFQTGYQRFFSGFGGAFFTGNYESPAYTSNFSPAYAAEFYSSFFDSPLQYAGTFYQSGFVGTAANNTPIADAKLWIRTA